jgi:hypothetical protein
MIKNIKSERKGIFMKKLTFKSGALALLITLVFVLPFTGCATLNPVENLLGLYEGTYTAPQGETGFTLNVYRSGLYYYAVFKFFPLPGTTNAESGNYYMSFDYNRPLDQWELKGAQWIERPSNYVFGNLIGTLKGDNFSGSVLYESGMKMGEFHSVRQRTEVTP